MGTINKLSKLGLLLSFAAVAAGCSSQMEKQRELELLADRRAEILSSSLPVNYGALSVVRAQAKQNTVIIEMLYADEDALSAQRLFAQAKAYYCTNNEIKTTLEQGINYQIRIRNNRGQMSVNELITASNCQQPES